MKHVWSIMCQRSIIDRDTNTLSLLDTIEELNIPIIKEKFEKEGRITIRTIFNFVHLILRDKKKEKEEGNILIEFYNPNNEKHKNKIIQKFVIEKPHNRIRVRIFVGPISFNKPGRYNFVIKLKSENENRYTKVAELPLDVNFIESQNLRKK